MTLQGITFKSTLSLNRSEMKILNIRVMRGPNYWSNHRHKLIVLKLDLEQLEQYPTNKIDGFYSRLVMLMPSLIEHFCSEGHRGGFFERVKEGTWMGHVIEHIALELQWQAGMFCGFGRTRSTGQYGVYNVVFSYEFEEAGLYAAHAAIRIVNALIDNTRYSIEHDVEQLKQIKQKLSFGPSTGSIVKEAERRNIPYRSFDNGGLVVFGQGIHQRRIQATIADSTSCIGVEIAGDKEYTKQLLTKACVPLPEGKLVNDEHQLNEAIADLGFPVVIKPVDGNHGRGVSTNIRNYEELQDAFAAARKISNNVIVERFIQGDDYRFLLVNYKLVAVAKRTPPAVIGDGHSSIQTLIENINHDPRRGEGHEKVLTTVKIDDATKCILKEKNYSLDTVLPFGEELFLKKTANISTGGTSTDVTDEVHQCNVFMAERIARIVGLDICGIDIVAKDVSSPITKKTGAVIEVNAAPGFRMHLCPSHGKPRNVAAPVMDMLFPEEKPSRIPVVAVSGTNGKTTTVRLVAHIAKYAGHSVGYTTTDGIYIQDHLIEKGDCTGPQSTETVLMDPTIDFAVLECARGGLLRAGLGFDHCDIAIITNVSEDHLGIDGINTLQDMARVKETVARSAFPQGYAILNADDDLVYKMSNVLDCHIALFSMHGNHERIHKHCAKGGLAAVIEKGHLVVRKGKFHARIGKIADIPLSFSGLSECMIRNIMASVLVGAIRQFKLEDIRAALKSFVPSPLFTPGRMNIFDFHDFRVMIDYAHNPAGLVELKKFIQRIDAPVKTGIIAAVGDRRDEDIRAVGQACASMFDEIIIRLDKDLRGRSPDDILGLLMDGIRQVKADMRIAVIPDETQAVQHAIKTAQRGAFITVLTDSVTETIDYVSQEKARKDNEALREHNLVSKSA
jgi:cyanophycin synthetase